MAILYWFRNDLRLHFNTALSQAIKLSKAQSATKDNQPDIPLCFIYIMDNQDPKAPSGASLWWLKKSLLNLKDRLNKLGADLHILEGSSLEVIQEILSSTKFNHLFYTNGFTPYEREQQSNIKQLSSEFPIDIHNIEQGTLCPLDIVKNKQDLPFKVFTPFYKKLKDVYIPIKQHKLPNNTQINGLPLELPEYQYNDLDRSETLWQKRLGKHCTPGEESAIKKLNHFIKTVNSDYDEIRDFPMEEGTSCLSPHLRFGEISPHYIWNRALSTSLAMEGFLRQLVWREFSYYLLWHFPHIVSEPFQSKYAHFPWLKATKESHSHITKWQQGITGYPIVDAGMRQLWQTGIMHNRVRMIVASFLTKHLLIHWRTGEQWFYDTLVDADVANNVSGWQWVSGSGADAAPYFRIFNPTRQSEKFDKNGEYIKKWIPELANLPNKYIHAPWTAPETILQKCNITLGDDYPKPMIDHDFARTRALECFKNLEAV